MKISIRNKYKYKEGSNSKKNTSGGFVILFAVLASTLILAMAVSIFNVAYKEQVLSGTTKASVYADAGANVGLECALYNDIKKHLFPDPNFPLGFPDPSGTGTTIPISVPSEINCVGLNSSSNPTPRVNAIDATKFSFTIETEDGYGIFIDPAPLGIHTNTNRPGCVKVFVDKNEQIGGEIITHVVSRGYNVACSSLQDQSDGTINPRIVERRSEVRYNSKGVPIVVGTTPTVDIFANGTGGSITIDENDNLTISWAPAVGSPVADYCEVAPGNTSIVSPHWNGTNPSNLSPNGSFNINSLISNTFTYAIRCHGVDGWGPSDNVIVYRDSIGSFDIPELVIKASGKGGNPPETEIEITLNPTQIEGTISWYPLHVKNCTGSSSSNTSWPISNPIPAINGSFTLNQMFPTTYPVGDFSPRIYTISCEWGDSTQWPGTPKTKSVKVNYQPVGVILPTANIWADPAVGANVGEFSSGGLLTLTQADAPYTIRWNSTDTTTCNETLEITSSGQILNGAHGFPQGLTAGSSTIDPALIEPGDYTYRISCNGGAANDFVNVLVNDASAVSSLDLKIKLDTESTYHDNPAGTNGSNNPVPIGSVNAPHIASATICDSGTCEANKVINLDWVGSNVSNCSATAKYKLSADPVSMWSTPTSVLSTAQQSITVTHYGVTKFTIACDKPDGSSISDTVFTYLTPTINLNSGGVSTQTSGEFHVPANIGSLMIGLMTSPGGQGGLATGNGVDGEDTYFNKDNGTATGLDFLVTRGGHGGVQFQPTGGTALGGAGGTTYYPASPASQGFFLLGHQEGVVGASSTTATGGAGGSLAAGPTVYILSGGSSIVSTGGSWNGNKGGDAVTSTTGGGGGGSGSGLVARFSVVPFQVFKFKAGALTPGTPLASGGTGINMQLGGDWGYNFNTNTYNNSR